MFKRQRRFRLRLRGKCSVDCSEDFPWTPNVRFCREKSRSFLGPILPNNGELNVGPSNDPWAKRALRCGSIKGCYNATG